MKEIAKRLIAKGVSVEPSCEALLSEAIMRQAQSNGPRRPTGPSTLPVKIGHLIRRLVSLDETTWVGIIAIASALFCGWGVYLLYRPLWIAKRDLKGYERITARSQSNDKRPAVPEPRLVGVLPGQPISWHLGLVFFRGLLCWAIWTTLWAAFVYIYTFAPAVAVYTSVVFAGLVAGVAAETVDFKALLGPATATVQQSAVIPPEVARQLKQDLARLSEHRDTARDTHVKYVAQHRLGAQDGMQSVDEDARDATQDGVEAKEEETDDNGFELVDLPMAE